MRIALMLVGAFVIVLGAFWSYVLFIERRRD